MPSILETVTVAARDRARMAQVSGVIARFGLESLLVKMGLGQGRSARGDNGEGGEDVDLPSRTRRAFEELGPTYVKLGQILATRRDLLTDDWIAAFEHLQTDAPKLPFEVLRPAVEAALGEAPETAFATFDTQPLAAASIAQVHRATLHDGQDVVVKIRRPNIRPLMEADLRLLRHLAALIEARSVQVRKMMPSAMIEQLGREILDELDFTNEGRNADMLRADLSSLDDVIVPRIHWEYTSEAVLVMDFVSGIPPRDPALLRDNGIDPSVIANLGARMVLEMVLVNGRFHADPHPGNMLCQPATDDSMGGGAKRASNGELGGRLALLDLGSVGFVSPRRQHEFLTFILCLRANDPGGVADMLGIWSQSGEVPRERLLLASERLVARHGTGALVLNAMVADFFPLLRKEGLVLPPDLVLIFKAMVTMDGVLSGIAPDFDLSEALGALRGRLVTSRLAGMAGPDRMEAVLLEVSRLSADAPRLMRAATARLERAEMAQSAPAIDAAPASAQAIRYAGALIAAAIVVHALAGALPALL